MRAPFPVYRYRCRNSIRPYNCERAFIQRHCGFSGTRPNFGRYTAKIPSLSVGTALANCTISREESPYGRITTITMDLSPRRLIRAFFFFISPRTVDTGLIIGNEETRLITRDKVVSRQGRPKFGCVAIYRKFRSIKWLA